MRSVTSHGYTIQYPDPIIWLYDLNKVIIKGNTVGFRTKIIVQNPDGDSTILEYTTRTRSITFILDDNLKYLWEKGNGDYSYSIYVDDVQIFSFGTKVLNGKSFLSKTHGSSTVIYHYDVDTVYDGRYIEVYAPTDARLVYGTYSYNVSFGWNRVYLPTIGITNTGDYDIQLKSRTADSITAFVVSDHAKKPPVSTIQWNYSIFSDTTTIYGGTLYERDMEIFPTTLKLHFNEVCPGDVVIQYTNSDGCLRQVSGKLLEVKDEFEPTKLNNVIRSEVYKHNPSFTNNNNSKTIKLGIYDMEAGCQINDIIFSDTLKILDINNNWTDCVLKTNSVVNYKNGGFDNLEFEVIISEL